MFLITIRRIIILFLILVISAFVLSCKSEKIKENSEEIHSQSEIVIVPNKLEISLQNITSMKGIKLASSPENVTAFPFVYVKKSKEDTRIIKIKEDSSTIDTIIERASSPLYQNAYIVEKGGDLNKTIARYVLDTGKLSIEPKNPFESFAIVSFTLKSISKKPLLLKDIELSIEVGNKEKRVLDLIISDVILNSSFPDVLEKGKSYFMRVIGLVPSKEKNLVFSCEGKKFKWEIK